MRRNAESVISNFECQVGGLNYFVGGFVCHNKNAYIRIYSKIMADSGEHSTFRFDRDIKANFKAWTYHWGTDMTTVIQQFMESYVKSSARRAVKDNAEAAIKKVLDGKEEK